MIAYCVCQKQVTEAELDGIELIIGVYNNDESEIKLNNDKVN